MQTGIHNNWDGGWDMTEKNKKKQNAKKMRNFWTCARPVTQIVPNKKAYSRKRNKDDTNKGRDNS